MSKTLFISNFRKMKKFIFKILLIETVFISIHILLVFCIPDNLITHRVIENIRAKKRDFFPSTFYPNKSITMDEVGDLAYHTKYSVARKNITWKTDKFGFRNNRFVQNPEIVFIGQSFVFGGALNQDETIFSKVEKYSGSVTYNMAPSSFNQFINNLSNNIISKPKVLVYCSVERIIPKLPKINDISNTLDIIKYNPRALILLSFLDEIYKSNYHNFLISYISNSKGHGIKSPQSNMFFLQGKKVEDMADYKNAAKHAQIIKSYSDKCDSLGIQFIFVPIPNKETTYYELVPLEHQPNYLDTLYKELQSLRVSSINVSKIFNQLKNKKLLYHLDDTHWNSNGADNLAREISRYLQSNGRLNHGLDP